MNEVNMVGNLTKDAEFHQSGDKDFMVLRIAVNHRGKDGKEETLYIDVTCFGYLVEYGRGVNLSKGDKVSVNGRLQERAWLDKNQNKRSTVCVLANRLFKCEVMSNSM
jgi:single stranded DNA-binding protein